MTAQTINDGSGVAPFRLSLTASDDMVDRAVPRFAAALDASR